MKQNLFHKLTPARRWLPAGFSLLLLLSACEEKLPEPTAKGANTFACKVNGKAWIPDAGGSFSGKKLSILYSKLLKPKINFVLYASQKTGNNTSIQLAVEDVTTIGTQYFNYDTNPYPNQVRYKNHAMYTQFEPVQKDYITNSHYTGSITFTRVDTVHHIIAGTFEFTAENVDGSGETVRVTHGRFDIDWDTLN